MTKVKNIAVMFSVAAASVSCNMEAPPLKPVKANAVEEVGPALGATSHIVIQDAGIVQEVVNSHYIVTANFKDSLLVKTVGDNARSNASPVDMAIPFSKVKDSADQAKIKELGALLNKPKR